MQHRDGTAGCVWVTILIVGAVLAVLFYRPPAGVIGKDAASTAKGR